MTQHKLDEPFGLLPKKTAMDLDSVGGLFSMPLPRNGDSGNRDQKLDIPGSPPAAKQPAPSPPRTKA